MKEKVEKLSDKKIEELFKKEYLSLEEISFLITQLDRKEAKKFQEEHKELMVNLMQTI